MPYEVNVCNDSEYIKSVLYDHEMWNRCSDDQTNYCLEKAGCLWLVVTKDGQRVGLSSIFNDAGCCLEIHINIPKANRGKGTLEMGRAIINWVKSHNVAGKSKIVTQIPVIHRDVIQFALKLGFVKEGINRQSVIIGGKAIDKVHLGITFGEIT